MEAAGYQCLTFSLNDDSDFNDIATVGSQCYKAGSGVIAMATFAMLFGLLAIAALHTYTTFKRMCGCQWPVPRLFVAIFSLLSLGLYIGVVVLWWVKCENKVSSLRWNNGKGQAEGPQSLQPGYALIVAVICIVFSALGWIFATIRSFLTHGDDDGNTTGGGSGTSKSSWGGASASPQHGTGSYNAATSPSSEGSANGYGSKHDTFGY